MTHLASMLAELAPGGVRYAALREVTAYSDTRVDASSLDEASFVGVDNLVSYFGGKANARHAPNTARLAAYEAGDVLVGNIRPYLRKIWYATNSGGCSGDVLALRVRPEARDTLLSDFLYTVLATDKFFDFNMKHAKGAKMPRGSKEAILTYRIPVPPLKVQREIVRTLARLARLQADLDGQLEAELNARQLQHHHYHRLLLSLGEADGERVRLSEALDLRAGQFVPASEVRNVRDANYPYPCFGANGVRGYVAEPNHSGRYVLIGRQGALSGNVKRVSGEFYATEHAVVGAPRGELDLDWVYQALTAMNLNQYTSKGAQPGLAVGTLNSLELLVPPLEMQSKIATRLDDLDSLIRDLSVRLRAERAARRRQYEYYRDKLLTFDEVEA